VEQDSTDYDQDMLGCGCSRQEEHCDIYHVTVQWTSDVATIPEQITTSVGPYTFYTIIDADKLVSYRHSTILDKVVLLPLLMFI